MSLSNKVPMFVYDKEHGMTPEKYAMLKKFSGEKNPIFTKEVWTCSEHGDFPVIGIVGNPAPSVVCPYCRDAALYAEESKDTYLYITLPYSGLHERQLKLELEGEVADKFKAFVQKEKVFMLVNDETEEQSRMSAALIVATCRKGNQGHYVTFQKLKYRIQASWKGRPNTEQLTDQMIRYPLLVIDLMANPSEDWVKHFLDELLVERIMLGKKTVLLAENTDVRNLLGGRINKKLNEKNTFEITGKQRGY